MTTRSDVTNGEMFGKGGAGAGVWCGDGVTKTKPSPTLFIILPPGARAEDIGPLFVPLTGCIGWRAVRSMVFVDFHTAQHATAAMRKYQNFTDYPTTTADGGGGGGWGGGGGGGGDYDEREGSARAEREAGCKVYVGNLCYRATKRALEDLFAPFGGGGGGGGGGAGGGGAQPSVQVATDRHTGKPSGYAFVRFAAMEQAAAAVGALNGAQCYGRALRVRLAHGAAASAAANETAAAAAPSGAGSSAGAAATAAVAGPERPPHLPAPSPAPPAPPPPPAPPAPPAPPPPAPPPRAVRQKRGLAIDFDKDDRTKRSRAYEQQREHEQRAAAERFLTPYACAVCGTRAFKIGLCKRLAELPKRKTDGATAVDEARLLVDLRVTVGAAKLIKRAGGVERQHRLCCTKCDVPLCYRSLPADQPSKYTYVLPGAVVKRGGGGGVGSAAAAAAAAGATTGGGGGGGGRAEAEAAAGGGTAGEAAATAGAAAAAPVGPAAEPVLPRSGSDGAGVSCRSPAANEHAHT